MPALAAAVAAARRLALLLCKRSSEALEAVLTGREIDATTALQRVQWAQDRHRRDTGAYATSLAQLRGLASGRSDGGLYRLELRSHGPDAYEAVAVAQAEQASDSECPSFSLRVDGFVSDRQPAGSCWSL